MTFYILGIKKINYGKIQCYRIRRKTKNPYIFKVNGKLVKLEFTDNGKSAEDAITSVIKSIYK